MDPSMPVLYTLQTGSNNNGIITLCPLDPEADPVLIQGFVATRGAAGGLSNHKTKKLIPHVKLPLAPYHRDKRYVITIRGQRYQFQLGEMHYTPGAVVRVAVHVPVEEWEDDTDEELTWMRNEGRDGSVHGDDVTVVENMAEFFSDVREDIDDDWRTTQRRESNNDGNHLALDTAVAVTQPVQLSNHNAPPTNNRNQDTPPEQPRRRASYDEYQPFSDTQYFSGTSHGTTRNTAFARSSGIAANGDSGEAPMLVISDNSYEGGVHARRSSFTQNLRRLLRRLPWVS